MLRVSAESLDCSHIQMSKKIWIWVIVVLAALLVIWKLPDLLNTNRVGLVLTGPTPTPTVTPRYVSGKKVVPAVSQTYEQALLAYAGKRIQFNEKCQGTPGQMVLKTGTKIMLDNRSKYIQTINLDGTKIVLPAYGWQTATVTTKNQLPYNFGIDCKSVNGTTENGAMINLQALIGR